MRAIEEHSCGILKFCFIFIPGNICPTFFILNLRNTFIPILVFLPPTIAALDMPRDNWTRHVLDV